MKGFYCMGDAARPDRSRGISAKGLVFDGRIKEDFKLSTGTWVSVGPLRARIIAHFAPYVRDAVIAGHDRDEVGLLLVPDVDACRGLTPDLAGGNGANRLRCSAMRGSELFARAAGELCGRRHRQRFAARAAPSCSKRRPRSMPAKSPTRGRSISAQSSSGAGRSLKTYMPGTAAARDRVWRCRSGSLTSGDRVTPAMNVDELAAIDVHVHLEHEAPPTETDAAARKYFGKRRARPARGRSPTTIARASMACVVFTVDEQLTGRPHLTNDDILAFAAANPDIALALRERRTRREVRQPLPKRDGSSRPAPSAASSCIRRYRSSLPTTAWRIRSTRSLPRRSCRSFFTPATAASAPACRGGGGIRLKYGNPMHIDDVAVDFPDMPIILAHPSFPWQDEAISVCLHKPQVYIDLSGWSPKYFSPTLVQYANTLLKHKVLFGSDYPWITPDRWLADFAKIDIRDDVRPLVLKANAARLFGL